MALLSVITFIRDSFNFRILRSSNSFMNMNTQSGTWISPRHLCWRNSVISRVSGKEVSSRSLSNGMVKFSSISSTFECTLFTLLYVLSLAEVMLLLMYLRPFSRHPDSPTSNVSEFCLSFRRHIINTDVKQRLSFMLFGQSITQNMNEVLINNFEYSTTY